MKNHPPRHPSAFTLLELIVAMTIVAFITILLATNLKTALSAQRSSEQAIDTSRSAELVMDMLRTDLQGAMPPQPTGTLLSSQANGTIITPQPGGTLAGNFEGTVNQFGDIVFFTTAPSPLHVQGANGEIKQIELTLLQPPGASDYALVRRTRNNLLPPSGQQEDPDTEILCRHVAGFDVQYYDGANWLPTWDSTTANADSVVNSLPTAVKITLSLTSAEKGSDGKPKVVRYTRIFQMPCVGQQVDVAATGSTGGG